MSLKPLEVKTGNIATKAVTNEKIADKAIDSRTIKDGAVTPDKLSIVVVSRPVSPPIDSTEIKDGAIKTDEIAGNAVTADKIAPNSITSEKILDGAVTREKIRDGAVTKEKMADGIIGTAEIIDGAVTSAKIADGAVTGSKIATNAVNKSKMTDNSVGYLEIINGSIEPRHIRAIDIPANGEIPSYNQLQERFEWVAPGGGGVTRPLTPPIATGEIADGAVTKPKLSYKVISITISALQVGGLYPPLGDPDLNGGVILGYSIPTNQDQLIRQLFLLPGLPQGTGISILLNQPAIADNTFEVFVLRQ
ncbi:MAG: hypothetical protein V1871_02505 [Planctomycetota bacterium]